jgi:hypothetical protein
MSRREITSRELDELLRSQKIPPAPADRVKQIESALTSDLKPVRTLAPAGVYAAGFGGIFLAVCIIGWYSVGQRGWHALSGVPRGLIFASLAGITALLVFSLVRQMTPAATHARNTALFGAAIFVLLLAMMTAMFHPLQESAFVRSGLACFRIGMTFAIPGALLFTLLLLRGAALSPALTGATAGGLAGLIGLAVLEVHCPNLDLYHILVWHVSVTIICALAGSGIAVLAAAYKNRLSGNILSRP